MRSKIFLREFCEEILSNLHITYIIFATKSPCHFDLFQITNCWRFNLFFPPSAVFKTLLNPPNTFHFLDKINNRLNQSLNCKQQVYMTHHSHTVTEAAKNSKSRSESGPPYPHAAVFVLDLKLIFQRKSNKRPLDLRSGLGVAWSCPGETR